MAYRQCRPQLLHRFRERLRPLLHVLFRMDGAEADADHPFPHRRVGAQRGQHVALLDPPYDLTESALTLNLQSLLPALQPDAAVLVERSSRSPEPAWPDGLKLVKQKRYGETVLWWAEPESAEAP